MACIEDRAFFIGHCILCRCHDTSRIHAAISQLSDKKTNTCFATCATRPRVGRLQPFKVCRIYGAVLNVSRLPVFPVSGEGG